MYFHGEHIRTTYQHGRAGRKGGDPLTSGDRVNEWIFRPP
jgi:hypothetical protein